VCAIGADCNAPDVEQRTPLMWAAEQSDEAMVRMLLSQVRLPPRGCQLVPSG
jgi:ankyrin repeat protein